jgi:hypothetical protein
MEPYPITSWLANAQHFVQPSSRRTELHHLIDRHKYSTSLYGGKLSQPSPKVKMDGAYCYHRLDNTNSKNQTFDGFSMPYSGWDQRA